MTMRKAMKPHLVGAGLAALMLAACGNQPERPAPDPTETTQPDPAESEGASIIRDDVPLDREPLPLEPIARRISFDEGGSDLSDTAIKELEVLLSTRQMEAGGPIILRGHTDSEGHDEANIRASQNRAEAVRDWLVGKGIPEDRFTIIAMGEQNPARPNAREDGSPDEAGRAFNRRVDVTVNLPPELDQERAEDAPTLVEQVTAEE